MKSFITALILTVAIVVFSLLYSYHINEISDYMVNENQQIIEYIETENYPEAARLAENLEYYLKKHEMVLAASIDHANLDKIKTYISQMKKYVQTGQKADSLVNCQVLSILLAQMPRDYALTIENIL